MSTWSREPAARAADSPPVRAPQAPDYVLLLTSAALLALGLVMILSSSSVTAAASAASHYDPYYYFQRQVLWVGVGLGAFLICYHVDYHHWRTLAPLCLAGTLALLLLVLLVGRQVNGSQRWLGLGPAVVQPSEIAKLTMVIVLSALLAGRTERQLRSFWRGAFPALALAGLAAGLILKEPDLGTAAALAATGGAAVPALAAAILGSPYRRERFLAFLHPAAQSQQGGYHILQSLYALGSGGLFGVGLGQSRQKWFYLPEEHTDFIFAVLGEELGFIGVVLVLALFGVLIWRGYRIAAQAPDLFGTLLAAGLTTMLAVQAIVNIAVVSGLLPVTGIPLPMISYGGSSLLFTLAGLGILAGISRHARA